MLGKTGIIIQSSYCKQDHGIACLQRGTILVLDVNGTPWSCVPRGAVYAVLAFLFRANCPLPHLS